MSNNKNSPSYYKCFRPSNLQQWWKVSINWVKHKVILALSGLNGEFTFKKDSNPKDLITIKSKDFEKYKVRILNERRFTKVKKLI